MTTKTDTEAQATARAAGDSRLASERRLDPNGRNLNRAKYDPSYVDVARKLAKLACTDLEIADYVGAKKTDVVRWRAEHPDFDAAIREGDAYCTERVRRSMYELAIGYTFEEERLVSNKGQIEVHTVRKHIPPNVQAGQFWLNNRAPDQWSKSPDYTPPPPPPQQVERPSEDELVNFLGDLLVRTKARADAQAKGTRH